MRSRLISSATLVARTSLVLVFRVAHADPPKRAEDPKQLAREHVIAARTLHAQHRLSDALSELEAAYALDPQPQLLFAMGQLHVQAGRCERAIAFYQRFLAQKPKPAEAAVAREAIQTCKTAPPPPIADPPRPAPASVALAVTRLPVPVIDASPPPAPPAPAPPALISRSKPPADGAATKPRTHRSHAGTIAGISLVTASIGAGVGSLLLYRGAVDDRDRAGSATSYDAYEDLIAQSNRKHRLSLLVGASGAAALTTSVIVFVVSRGGRKPQPAAAFQIVPSATGAVASWRASF